MTGDPVQALQHALYVVRAATPWLVCAPLAIGAGYYLLLAVVSGRAARRTWKYDARVNAWRRIR